MGKRKLGECDWWVIGRNVVWLADDNGAYGWLMDRMWMRK